MGAGGEPRLTRERRRAIRIHAGRGRRRYVLPAAGCLRTKAAVAHSVARHALDLTRRRRALARRASGGLKAAGYCWMLNGTDLIARLPFGNSATTDRTWGPGESCSSERAASIVASRRPRTGVRTIGVSRRNDWPSIRTSEARRVSLEPQ